jgi:hypothetical protein
MLRPMLKFLTTLLASFILATGFGQTERKVSVYLLGQYNKTIYDRVIPNNPWGVGLGVQLYLNTRSKFKPTIEFTADTYLEDDKVLRLNPDGTMIDDLGGMTNLFAGICYQPIQTIYISFVAGPSFSNGQTLLGIKPSIGFYFSDKQKWTMKFFYLNVFNRDKTTNEDFGTIGLGIGLRLF